MFEVVDGCGGGTIDDLKYDVVVSLPFLLFWVGLLCGRICEYPRLAGLEGQWLVSGKTGVTFKDWVFMYFRKIGRASCRERVSR